MHIIEDPIHDGRWSDLLTWHPGASVFHTPAWLEALRRAYGYESVVVTRSRGSQIENGLVTCRVRAWGANRLVSVPFADHCDPLASASDLPGLVEDLVSLAGQRRRGMVELRPRSADHALDMAVTAGGLRAERTYCLHTLDISPELRQIFAGFQHSSTQRAVRRAEREGVTHEVGTSDEQLHAFFTLLRMARRRHGLPPQPMAWFRHLRDTMGPDFAIHLARHRGRPVAAILTLSFRTSVVYKYGGSDASCHALGVMPFLFWQVIQSGKAAGATTLDLGRSDRDQPGLITFKGHLGARPSNLTYYSSAPRFSPAGPAWMSRISARLVSAVPDTALDMAGRLLYRHFG